MLIAVKKSKFIVSFVIIFGTLSFPIQSYTTQLDLHCGSKTGPLRNFQITSTHIGQYQ